MKTERAPYPLPKLPLAILGLTMLAGLAIGPRLFRENKELNLELGVLRAAQASGTAPDTKNVPTAEMARLSAESESETALLHAAEEKARELGKALPRISEEEWRSLGKVEELGAQAADFIRVFSEMQAAMRGPEPRQEADGVRLVSNLFMWMKRMEVIGEMEDDAAEVARLHTATLSARMKLDAPTQERVRLQIEREFSQLAEKKLTRPQRPDTARDEWYARRKTALDEATQRIEALIPAAQREQFAVGQSLHLGTGMRTKTDLRPDGHGSVYMMIDLPGLDWRF